MVSVFDVAKYILEERGRMSTWKLQKLCYYAQAWHFTWTEHRLIKERFEAWRNGPVCPELFQLHKGQFWISSEDIPQGNPSKMDEDERDSVDVVLKDYGDFAPYSLMEMTHSEKPWQEARGDLPPDQNCDVEITPESMGRYYGSL